MNEEHRLIKAAKEAAQMAKESPKGCTPEALVEAVARAIAVAWDNEGRVIDAAIAAIALIRPATLEEAAKLFDEVGPVSVMADTSAAAIRALKENDIV